MNDKRSTTNANRKAPSERRQKVPTVSCQASPQRKVVSRAVFSRGAAAEYSPGRSAESPGLVPSFLSKPLKGATEGLRAVGLSAASKSPVVKLRTFAPLRSRLGLGPQSSIVNSKLAAFSMAELMIAVVILGIGLLVTSSMFPIAWYKARDVAEATNLNASSDAADLAMKLLVRSDSYIIPDSDDGDAIDFQTYTTSLFPGDWLPNSALVDPFDSAVALEDQVAVYPDVRVHHMNMGNYLALAIQEYEMDWLCSADCSVRVADNAWSLDDSLAIALTDPMYLTRVQELGLHRAIVSPHTRLVPPLPQKPTAPEQLSLWNERFESRRYCWSVFYKFGEMPGTSGSSDSAWGSCVATGLKCDRAKAVAATALLKPRRVTMYHFMLKRPGNARYARQEGFIYDGSSGEWNTGRRPDTPRALPPAQDVVLPVPWRIEGTLTGVPAAGAAPTGIPSEVRFNDPVIMGMLQVGSTLIDDRTGRVFRITAVRVFDAPDFTVTLDGEYTAGEIVTVADFTPNPADTVEMAGNWQNYWNCTEDVAACILEETDDPGQRFYWVFPPPVEAQRSVNGEPIFDGSQPVAGVEVRQMIVAPPRG